MQAPNWTDFLSCSVCMSKYNCHNVVPVSLGCCHTLCKRCLVRIKTNTCPYDRTPIPLAMSSYPPNTSLLVLLGYDRSDWTREMTNALSSRIIPESDLSSYTKGREAMEKLSMFLKSFIDQGVLQATSTIPRPVLKKLVTLLSCQILDIEGRGKALRAAHSISERIITELLIMHQNPQQIPALLWTAVRNRGCQFLGPIMQEEALRLILKVLETGPHLSRKNIVLYVVQQLQSDFPNASKTNIGHVVQLLYRASCFNVEKREDESSLMQLKEEYRTYESLRREHDAQIIKIAMEAGLRITPETWSTQLYGSTNRKSEMQSIIDKLVSQGVASSGLSELIVAVGRSQDPQGLSETLIPHLDSLLKVVTPAEKMLDDPTPPQDVVSVAAVFAAADWEPFTQGIEELLVSLQSFTEFSQIHYKDRSDVHTQAPPGKYKTGICPYLTKPGGCPRGHLCPYAHSEEEKRKYVNIAKTIRRQPSTGSGCVPVSGGVVNIPKLPTGQPMSLTPTQPLRSPLGAQRGPPIRQKSDELSSSPYSSLEESNGYGSFPGGTVVYQSDPRTGTAFIVPSVINLTGTAGGTPSYHHGPSSLEGYNAPPPPSGYHSYDLAKGRGSIDNYSKVDVPGSLYYPKSDSLDSHATPTSLAVSIASSLNYKQGGGVQLSAEGVSPPTTGSVDGERNMKEEYQLQNAMENLKVGGDSHKKPDMGSDVGDKRPRPPSGSSHNMVDELHARIQHLEAELQSRRVPERRVDVPHVDGIGTHYQSSLPNYYGSSPRSGEIMRTPNFSGPLHPPHPPPHHQYAQTQSASLPVDTGYYHPLYGGLPGHIPGHPWSGQLGPMVVSPHTTPPNTQLIMTGPNQPMPNPMHQPHPQMIAQDHYSQIENDSMIAHFIQFAEQSKAQGYHVAPGAQLTPTPMVHQGPAHHYHGFNYRPQPHIMAGQHMYK